jgi:phosphotransferase system enzyme I (PtsI)
MTGSRLESEGWDVLRGRCVSGGRFEGLALVLDDSAWLEPARAIAAKGDAAREFERLREARGRADDQLSKVEGHLARQGRRSDAEIFGAHRALLGDPALESRIEVRIRERGESAEAALAEVTKELHLEFAAHRSPMVQDKAADVLDVGQRWLRSLNPTAGIAAETGKPTVLVAQSLTPSELVRFAQSGPCAAVVNECGARSHVAILARSLGVPLVAGVSWPVSEVFLGARLFLDGDAGLVLVVPEGADPARIDSVRADLKEAEPAPELPRQPRTRDDVWIQISLNISDPSEASFAGECGAAGVGLFRTEFLYMARDSWPTEEESFEAYRQVADAVGDGALHVRLADFGADKRPSYADFPMGRNPSLGLRGVRLLLEREDILAPQLRAIARVAAKHPLVLLVPMLDGPDSLEQLVEVIERVLQVGRDSFPFQLGAMIEVPAAALSVGSLLDRVDHAAIGLNDLTQYVMAADREDEDMERYHDPLTPAVLGLVDRVISEARARGKGVSVCGELAGDPGLAQILIALGVRALSVSRPDYFAILNTIEGLSVRDLSPLAERIRRATTAREIRELSGLVP